MLADGTVHPHRGRFHFADREVNARTGAIRIAALFANPDNTLRPGQYARVRFSVRSTPGALLVPQRAVSELQGGYQVAVVGGDNKVNIRGVKVADRVGAQWIVSEGLHTGERVVAEGLQKIRDGVTVNPIPYEAAKPNMEK